MWDKVVVVHVANLRKRNEQPKQEDLTATTIRFLPRSSDLSSWYHNQIVLPLSRIPPPSSYFACPSTRHSQMTDSMKWTSWRIKKKSATCHVPTLNTSFALFFFLLSWLDIIQPGPPKLVTRRSPAICSLSWMVITWVGNPPPLPSEWLFAVLVVPPCGWCCDPQDPSLEVKVKVKQSRYRPGVAQRVPGS